MKIAVLYNLVEQATEDIPLPNNWDEILQRFRNSYVQHPAGIEHDLYLCASGAPLSSRSRHLFAELKYRTLNYIGKGWDIGAYQHCAGRLLEYDLVFFMNSQAFVVTDEWLSPFAGAYASYGPGIYGASSSFEVSPHIRTSAFAASPQLLLRYPLKVKSRYDACVFEHSPTNFAQWAIGRKYPVQVVMCSGTYPLMDSRRGADIFRRGSQKDLIINDRHTLLYELATGTERKRLEQLADGKIPVDFTYQNRLKRWIARSRPLQLTWRTLSNLKH